MFYLWFDPGISVSNIEMISSKNLASGPKCVLYWNIRVSLRGPVSQQQQWTSREVEAGVPAPGKAGDPAYDGWPCAVSTATNMGHWDVLQGSERTLRCHKHQVQGGWSGLACKRLESFADSVPGSLGQHPTTSIMSLSFLPVNHYLLHNISFQCLQWMKWVPWGEKKVL